MPQLSDNFQLGESLQDRFLLKGSTDLPSQITSLDFLVLKPFGLVKESHYTINAVSIVCFNDGTLNLYDLSGELLYRYSTGHKHLFCAGTQSTDEIYIASADSTEIRVHKVEMPTNTTTTDQEYGPKCSRANLSISLLSASPLFNGTEAEPTAFVHYSRLGKKYWVVGDNKGNINVYHANGESFSRGSAGVSSIKSLDRSGQQLAYAGDRTIGIYNLGTMEPHIVCDPAIHNVVDIAIDFTSSILHATFDNGEVLTYDTRFTANNSPSTCKAISRLVNKYGNNETQLMSIKGSLLAWGQGVIVAFNTSYLESELIMPPAYYSIAQLPDKESSLIAGFKLPMGGHYLAVGSGKKIAAYEISPPTYRPPSPSEGFDYGSVRIIAIALAIIAVVFWKAKNRKSRPQQEVEKLEKGLEELQRTISQTSEMSASMGQKLRDVETEAKKSVRFSEKPTYNYLDEVDYD